MVTTEEPSADEDKLKDQKTAQPAVSVQVSVQVNAEPQKAEESTTPQTQKEVPEKSVQEIVFLNDDVVLALPATKCTAAFATSPKNNENNRFRVFGLDVDQWFPKWRYLASTSNINPISELKSILTTKLYERVYDQFIIVITFDKSKCWYPFVWEDLKKSPGKQPADGVVRPMIYN
jgi:hypothetical protein